MGVRLCISNLLRNRMPIKTGVIRKTVGLVSDYFFTDVLTL